MCGRKYAQLTTYRKDGATVDVQLCGLIRSPSVDLDDSTGKSIKSDAMTAAREVEGVSGLVTPPDAVNVLPRLTLKGSASLNGAFSCAFAANDAKTRNTNGRTFRRIVKTTLIAGSRFGSESQKRSAALTALNRRRSYSFI